MRTTGFASTSLFIALAAGTYTLYVKDSKGCTGTVDIEVKEPLYDLAATVTATPFKCDT
jgi:hypothetical protein